MDLIQQLEIANEATTTQYGLDSAVGSCKQSGYVPVHRESEYGKPACQVHDWSAIPLFTAIKGNVHNLYLIHMHTYVNMQL